MTGFDPQISELTENGAWCWFADPRAIYFKGKVQVSLATALCSDGTFKRTLCTALCVCALHIKPDQKWL